MFACGLAALVGGCSMLGMGGDKPETTAATNAGAIDPRRFIGPNYCPELRIPEGMQLVRQYEKGHQDDSHFVIWQASLGKTARDCLYDLQGGLTLRIGVSGRIIAGPKGVAGPVTVPLKIAIVKYQEAVLTTQTFDLAATLSTTGSAAFNEVREIYVPSPGTSRDYIIYVGFAATDWDPMHPVEPPAPVVEEPVEPLPEEPLAEAPPPPPPKKQTPQELPTPKGLIPGL